MSGGVASTGTQVVNSLVSAPLPQIIEKLGLSVATAQAALDKNSIEIASEMANTNVTINNKEYNLLALGFKPTFYAFTEATVEAKMEFSMQQSQSFEIGGEIKGGIEVISVSITASYARKFEMQAEGSSSIAARMISLPAPERLNEILSEIAQSKS